MRPVSTPPPLPAPRLKVRAFFCLFASDDFCLNPGMCYVYGIIDHFWDAALLMTSYSQWTRSNLLWTAWLLVLSLLVAGCSGDSDTELEPPFAGFPKEESVWRFALEEVEGSVQHAYARAFAREIESRSDGAISVEIYPYGTLGSSPELRKLAQEGEIELIFASPGHLADAIPEVGIFTLHFILSDDTDVNRRVLSSAETHDLFHDAYHREQLQLLAIVPEGWMVWSANHPLTEPEHFRDFRMRTMNSRIKLETYRAYGARPVAMTYADVFSHLQLGDIDGQSNPIFAIEEMKFYEHQDVLTAARHAHFVATLAASLDWYQNLPEEQQAWIQETRDDLVDWIYEEQERFNEERLETILSHGGTEYVELTDDQREVFRQASLNVRQIYLEQAGASGHAILEQLLTRIEEETAAP